MTAQDGLVLSTAQTSAKAAEGQNARPRVHPPEPPARLPGLRQGRRVPAPGPHVPLGPGRDRMRFRKRTFDKPIPVSPLIALDRERCILCYRCTRFSEDRRRGRAARGDQPRRGLRHRHLRRRALSGALLRQRPRALPGRRAHLDDLPVPRPALGDPERPHGLRPLPGRVQHLGDDARGQGGADPLEKPRRGGRRVAVRQGPLRLRTPEGRRPDLGPAAPGAPTGLRAGLVGAGSGRGRARPAGGRRPGGRRLLGRRDRGDRHRDRAARRRKGSEEAAHCSRTLSIPPSTASARRSRRFATRMSASSSGTSRSSSEPRFSTSGSAQPAARAPRSSP